MSELVQYMLPIIAFMVTIRDGIIIWAIKISVGIGCLAGIIAINIYKDVLPGFRTLLSVTIGCYLVLYLLTVLRTQKRNREKER